MGFRSLFTKGVAVTSAGRTSQHSRKASSYAKQAINCFYKSEIDILWFPEIKKGLIK